MKPKSGKERIIEEYGYYLDYEQDLIVEYWTGISNSYTFFMVSDTPI